PLRIDVDDERDEEDEAADQDLQERVDLDVIEAVIEDAEDEQPDDRVADAAAPAEQAGAADHHRRDRVEEEGVELVLLGAAEIGDGEHAGDARADRRDDHHRGEDGLDVDAGIFGGLAVAADHVHVAAEARVGEDEMRDEEHEGGDDDDPRHAADRLRAEGRDEVGDVVGDLAADEQRADAGRDLHHGQRHDEGRDADQSEPDRVDRAEDEAGNQRQGDRDRAGEPDIGDVDVVGLGGEEGDDDAGRVGDRGDRQVDLGAQDDEGEADRDDPGDG